MSQTVTRTDRLKAAHEKLQDAVQSIIKSDDESKTLGLRLHEAAAECVLRLPQETMRLDPWH